MNMNKMLQQAQKMQKNMEIEQKEIENTLFEESFQDEVKIEMFGSKEIKKINISKDFVDTDDIEMLEDVLTTTINKLISKIDSETSKRMEKYTNNIGGSLPF